MLEFWNWAVLILEAWVGCRSLSGASVRAFKGQGAFHVRFPGPPGLGTCLTSQPLTRRLLGPLKKHSYHTYHCVFLEHVCHLLVNLQGEEIG